MKDEINLYDELLEVLPNATTAAKMPPKQPKCQTLDEARAKVVAKALRNKSDYVPPDGEEVRDRIYKWDSKKKQFAVGLKCGNRWMDHKLIKGESVIYVDTEDEIDIAIDKLVEWTEAGYFDETIAQIMQANCWRDNK